MKSVPFVANSEDDAHCVQAVFRMVHQYYFGRDLNWKTVDQLSHAMLGKGTWTFTIATAFAKKGLDILNIGPLDPKKLHAEKFSYLKQMVGADTAHYYETRSNLNLVFQYIPEYLEWVDNEVRRPTMDEIIQFLKNGALVGAEINSSVLNNQPGFNLHFVLLYEVGADYFLLHDPGLPPLPARKVTFTEFKKCFNYPGANEEITVFRKKK